MDQNSGSVVQDTTYDGDNFSYDYYYFPSSGVTKTRFTVTINESSTHTYNLDSEFYFDFDLGYYGPYNYGTLLYTTYTIQTDMQDCTTAAFLADYSSTSQLTIQHVVADYAEMLTSIDTLVQDD